MNRRDWLKTGTAAAAGFVIRPRLRLVPRPMRSPIRLHFNENPYGPSPAARRAITNAFSEGNLYPYASWDALESLVAEREGLTPDHVVLGAGSTEVLRMTAMAYGLAGGEVLTGFPTYEGLEDYARSISAHVHRVPVDDNLDLDLDAMARRTTQAVKLVFLCNPNNPTGTIRPASEVRAFCRDVSRRTVVLVDEAYYELVDDPAYESMVDLVREGENVIVTRTFSKVYGLAGLRVGYGLARPDIAERLRSFRTGSSINVLGARAAIASYNDPEFVRLSRERIAATRTFATEFVQGLGHRCVPSHTNFIFFHLGSDINTFRKKMEKRGILVGRPFPPFQDWCRLSIGTDEEMHAFAEAFRAVRG